MTRFSEILLGTLLLAGLSACSVKEDREPCPCYLDVDYSRVLETRPMEDVPGRVEVAVKVGGHALLETHKLQDCPRVSESVVDRLTAHVIGIVHGNLLRDFLRQGDVLTWKAGNQIDSVFVYSQEIDCSGEEAYCLIEPHKQFHTIFFTDETGGTALRQYNMVVTGSTCGFRADNFEAVEGEYLYTVQEYDRDGGISVRVPRQKNDDLRLELWTKDDFRKVFTAPIGQYMKAAGYDKTATDLVDFRIDIHFRDALVYVRVADWDEEQVFALYK